MRNKTDKPAPSKRTKGLIKQSLGDELIVYDQLDHSAHCLNDTAARVFLACDGEKTITRIARHISQQLDRPVPEELIWDALLRLSRINLLSEPIDAPLPAKRGMSRREFMRGAAAAAMVALPAITSLVAPTPSEAQSIGNCGQPCQNNADCAGGQCNSCAPMTGPGNFKRCI